MDEFRELMISLEGGNIANERIIMLFNEALEMTTTEKDGGTGAGGPDKMSP